MKKRVKRYDGEDDSLVESDMPAQRIEFSEDTRNIGPTRDMSFKEAFAKHRALGDKTFEWKGTTYTTKLDSPKSSKTSETAPKTAKAAETATKSVMRMDAMPKARTIASDMDELARAKASMGNVNMLPRGRMSPPVREEVIKSTPKRSGYTIPKSSEFTGMGSMKFAGGGMTASKRGDGIAQRGKTKGTIVMCGGGYMKGKK